VSSSLSDIIDMAWSRDDSMLASVGLDSTVWIWDGRTFGELGRCQPLVRTAADAPDRIKKLDKHEGFVKGVCWDPVGNFLATQVSYFARIVRQR
jgi:protein HIRA/HIR1